MKEYVIANPPVGIYKGDLPLNYAYIHVLLDVHKRYLEMFENKNVFCPKYSLNVLGKRAEKLNIGKSIGELRNYTKMWIEKSSLRDKLNLSFEGIILDCDSKAIKQAQNVFLELFDKGYIFKEESSFYLDVNKIFNETNLESIVNKMRFYPKRAKGEFKRLIQNNREPVKITKERVYGAPNPLGDEKISPIFVVSNLWEAYVSGEVDLITCSEKELARYLLLRTYCRAPLSKNLPARSVLIYNYIELEGGFGRWDISRICRDSVGSDSLRYAFIKGFSLNKQKKYVNKKTINAGRNLVYLISNIKKCLFEEKEGLEKVITTDIKEYIGDMTSFKYNKVLCYLEDKFHNISREINILKNQGKFYLGKNNLFHEYISSVKKIYPFLPFISEKIMESIKNEQKK